MKNDFPFKCLFCLTNCHFIVVMDSALGTYNSISDPHLNQYFRKPQVRTHMVQAGLMTSEGKVIPEAVIRLRELEAQRRQQLHILLNEVLEKGEENKLGLKRLHQTRDLESEAKRELVDRAKMAFQSNGSTGLTTRAQSNNSSSGRTHKSTPSTTSMGWLRRVVQMRPKLFSYKKRIFKMNSLKRNQRPRSSYGVRSSNKVKPDLQTDLSEQFADIVSLDGQSLQDSDSEDNDMQRFGLWPKKTMASVVTLRFNGLTPNCLIPRRVQISQQLYSGGNAIIIFDRMIAPGENLTFHARPHEDKPFCITVLIDGIRDLRVSTCCEHKHRKGSKISHFTLIDVRGGKMCDNCRKGINYYPNSVFKKEVVNNRHKNSESNDIKSDKIVNKTEVNVIVSDSDVDDCQQTVVEMDRKSTGSSSPINGDYNEEHYESEFEPETPESLCVKTNSVSSDDDFDGHQEVVSAEIHDIPYNNIIQE